MFFDDERIGKSIEYEFANLLLKLNKCKSFKVSDGYNKDFDIITNMNETYEIKYDLMFLKTGNIAIEYKYKENPSGISSTKADYWVHLINRFKDLPDRWFIINVSQFKEWLKLNWSYLKKVNGGDDGNSRLILLKPKDMAILPFVDILDRF